MLSLTGALIAFQQLTGGGGGGEAAERLRGSARCRSSSRRWRPMRRWRAPGAGRLGTLTWPTRPAAPMDGRVRGRGDCVGRRRQPVRPPRRVPIKAAAGWSAASTTATGMGLVWQILIFIAGADPGRARGHRHRDVAPQPRLARRAGGETQAGSMTAPAYFAAAADFPRLARDPSQGCIRTPRRLLEEGQRPALDRLARSARRGALLRLDRRGPQIAWARSLHHPLHPAPQRQHLVQRQCRALRRAHRRRADDPGGRPPPTRRIRAPGRLFLRERAEGADARGDQIVQIEQPAWADWEKRPPLLPQGRAPLDRQREAGRDPRAPPRHPDRRQRRGPYDAGYDIGRKRET